MTQYIEIAESGVDRYCIEMGVDTSLLSQNYIKKKKRVTDNGLSLAFIRQSLAHFLYKRLPLNAATVGKIVGYKDHSMVSLYSRIVENHFEVDDYALCLIITNSWKLLIQWSKRSILSVFRHTIGEVLIRKS